VKNKAQELLIADTTNLNLISANLNAD